MKKKFKFKLKPFFLILGALILLFLLSASCNKKVYSFVYFIEELFYEYDNTPEDCFIVSRIIDGDTIVILNENNKEERITLVDIDAFETKKNDRLRKQMKKYNLTENEVIVLGNKAKKYLEEKFVLLDDSSSLDNSINYSLTMIDNNDQSECVYITRKGEDKYGRTLAKVYYGWVNGERGAIIQSDLLDKKLVNIY
ncbi:thermonuclease family protein [Pseudomonadota bacterium]